jgi:hypothetical protein
MIKRVNISPAIQRQEDLLRQKVLSASLPFEKSLSRYRTRLINSIAKELGTMPPSEWEGYVRTELKENYLRKWYPQLYMTCGSPAGERAIRQFLSIKSTNDMNTWERALYEWIGQEMGNKIVIVEGTLKEWVINTIMQYYDEHSTEGVEKIVEGVEVEIRKKWRETRQWQIRRIVQTESLTAMSEAADVAIKSLGIKYNKTWGISGNNTRPAHQVMNGITIGQDDLFNVDGESLALPRDSKHGASAGNIINCRCFCIRKPLNQGGQDITDEDILNLV